MCVGAYPSSRRPSRTDHRAQLPRAFLMTAPGWRAACVRRRMLLRWFQWRGLPPHVEVAMSVGSAYVSYLITEFYVHGSGARAACQGACRTGSPSGNPGGGNQWQTSLLEGANPPASRLAVLDHAGVATPLPPNTHNHTYTHATTTTNNNNNNTPRERGLR